MKIPQILPSSLFGLVWESFRSTSGPAMSFLGLSATLLAWIFSPQTKVNLSWFVLTLSFLGICLVTLFNAVLVSHRSAGRRFPRVRMAAPPPAAYRDIAVVLLLDSSDLFALDSIVSIYEMQQQDYEVLVALGRVLTAQDNGLIQVGVQRILDPSSRLLERLLGNDSRALQALIVKPSVPRYEIVAGDQS